MTATAEFIKFEEELAEHVKRYDGDASFLAPATARTRQLWEECSALIAEELKLGILGLDTKTVSTITSHGPGYIHKELETIVGFQTDKPLVRAMKPFGGLRIVEAAAKAYHYEVDPEVSAMFDRYIKTHNDGVFQCYTEEMRVCRSNHIITGLPDGYGRGRIIGDYRRVAAYGTDKLVELKKADRKMLESHQMDEETMRLRVEVFDQIAALNDLKKMAATYGHDIGRPAQDSQEAIQWLYYAYLGSVKQQDGAAMSFGRIDSFLDSYIEKDLASGKFTEEQIQEFIDHFVIKLRLVRHLRTPEYNELFAGDPTWVTLVLGGSDKKGRHMVTRTSYRIVHTLYNLGPAPEPNLTILWGKALPNTWKNFCAKVSIDTSSIQYENDDLMRDEYGSDYSIACCVSAMRTGKDMQYFGARCNLAKLLLYTLNNGVDEKSGMQVGPRLGEIAAGALNFDQVFELFRKYMVWLAKVYVETMNIIHWSHDRYCYESLQMALHDTFVRRLIAFGIAGLSHVADSLSAIKFAKVTPIRDDKGIAKHFTIEGEFPKYGNDDDRVDSIAVECVEFFMAQLRSHPTYRKSVPTLSILTITSNVVYGRATGDTPDGRVAGAPFAPGASPSYGADTTGAANSLASVAKLPYAEARDGISNTFAILPSVLGKEEAERCANLSTMINQYFDEQPSHTSGFHLNVNCVTVDTLKDAMDHPEKYPQLTVRVSGYAVNFVRLTREQQMDVLSRTFHDKL